MTLGVDIGGSHLSCALVDEETKVILTESISNEKYDHRLSEADLLKIWVTAIEAALSHLPAATPLTGIGFAMPGPFEYANGISKMEHKLAAFYNKHLPTLLNQALNHSENIAMRFNNDATCFAIGEAFCGLGRDKKRMTVITLGTGFGSAFLEEKVPVVERADVPPEGCLWHLPFKDGIADEYFSTRWFIGKYEELTQGKVSGVKALLEKDPAIIQAVFMEFTDNLSGFIAQHLQKFGAEILVMGGNISKALDHFKSPLIEKLEQRGVQIEIVPSTLLENAALIGSASLFDQQYWERVSKVLPKL
ncbi:MAG: ROK family protein [Saprospiraceae bacterium]